MKASTGVRQTAAESRELVISETGQRKLHIRGDSSLHWFLEMDHCFMWGSTSDRHSFDCLARLSLQEVPAGVLPATKLDVTEVQWDLSWMEMSNLLEKDSYCGT
ncbi:unnamed protein product [Pleuronectes platessa]|uniref:Uncharacterized protein n=1 Tax=Pleuronectes platessa TaxID=8262 RepID=A0A9N7ZCR3_PLEPL|nr:unnamed protein product [Pleuronectes platessa]